MFEFATCEMEEFEEGVFDVIVDAARFAFLQTLHSSFESVHGLDAAVDKPQKQTFEEKPREDKADDDRRAAVLKGRPKRRLSSFFRAKSKARVSDASEGGEQNMNPKKLKPTRSFFVPHLKSLVSCFRGQMPVGEEMPVKEKKNKTTFRHRATKSGEICLERIT